MAYSGMNATEVSDVAGRGFGACSHEKKLPA